MRSANERPAPAGRFWVVLLALWPLIVQAGEPTTNEPFPVPFFSIDLASPTIGPVQADDVLSKPGPIAVFLGPNLGLGLPGDDIDGVSLGNFADFGPEPFALVFSVDRLSIGLVPPDPGLVALGFQFNVFDQAMRGQAAGDAYLSTNVYPPLPAPQFAPPDNNVLLRNQGDAGGVDYDLFPEDSPEAFYAEPIDELDAFTTSAPAPGPLPDKLYFTVTASSPSLGSLPGTNSGADIYFDSNLFASGSESLFASPAALGLLDGDDIDAIIVFDADADGTFDVNAGDRVIFSLTRESPTVFNLGLSASDVLAATNLGLQVLAEGEHLGLDPLADNVDALTPLFTGDIDASIDRHCIRINPDCTADANIVGVDSVREHAGVVLGINLMATGGIEPRKGGPQRLGFRLDRALDPLTVVDSNVQIACADSVLTIESVEYVEDGPIVSVILQEPPIDTDCCSISFDGMITVDGGVVVGHFDVIRLEGDLNFSGSVSGGDAALIKPHFGEIAGVDLAAPQWDFDVSGAVTGGDFSLIKPRLGNIAVSCEDVP